MRHSQQQYTTPFNGFMGEAPFTGNKLTAVPPTNFNGNPSGVSQGGSTEEAIVGRLRACSEGQKLGLLTEAEKQRIKTLIRSKGIPPEALDAAIERRDWEEIKAFAGISGSRGDIKYDNDANGVIHHMSEVCLDGGEGANEAFIKGPGTDFSNIFDFNEPNVPYYDSSINTSVAEPEAEFERPQGSFLIDENHDEEMTHSGRKRMASRDRIRDMASNFLSDGFGRSQSKRIKPESNHQLNGMMNGVGTVNSKSRLSDLNPRTEGSFLKHLRKLNPASAAMDIIHNKEHQSKTKKNERERKRRLAVSKGFEDLASMLKPFDAAAGRPHSSKIDKATILRNTIETLKELHTKVTTLERRNKELTMRCQAMNGR